VEEVPFFLIYNNVKQLSPGQLTYDNLLYLQEDIFSLEDIYEQWYNELQLLQQYYIIYREPLKILFDIFLEKTLNYLLKMNKKSEMLLFQSKKYLLKNILCTLESYMNEMRKTDLAFGFYKEMKGRFVKKRKLFGLRNSTSNRP